MSFKQKNALFLLFVWFCVFSFFTITAEIVRAAKAFHEQVIKKD